MTSFDLLKLPAEIRLAIMKEAALNGWRGSNAVCHLDVLQVVSRGEPHVWTYQMTNNEFLKIISRNAIHTLSTEGLQSARDALRDARPLYVLLIETDFFRNRPMPPNIPRSVIALPRDLLPSEAFVDIMSEPFHGASDFLPAIAGVFGPRVKRIYILNPCHRFTTTGMVQFTDTLTMREYACRAPGPRHLDPTSLMYTAATLLRRGRWPRALKYLRYRDTRPETTIKSCLTPETSRVVTSQATGEEFAEVWRQGRDGGEKRLAAFYGQSWSIDKEIRKLRSIVVDLLLISQESGSVLPDLESISVMTVSRMAEEMQGKTSLRTELQRLDAGESAGPAVL